MDEDIAIINTNSRNEKIKNFFLNNKKNLITLVSIILLILIGYFVFKEVQKQKKINTANQYNTVILEFESLKKNKRSIAYELTLIVDKKDESYSPLALYFLIDNNFEIDRGEINRMFDVLINKTSLEKEIKNLLIYKKALFNSDVSSENDLILTLGPLINSDSIWKSHALYLVAEFFYSKGEKKKSKEFFEKILILDNSNPDIKLETQKRLSRDISE